MTESWKCFFGRTKSGEAYREWIMVYKHPSTNSGCPEENKTKIRRVWANRIPEVLRDAEDFVEFCYHESHRGPVPYRLTFARESLSNTKMKNGR